MRRAVFFLASVPLAILAAVVLTDRVHALRFWICELPLLAFGFAAWVAIYFECCGHR